MEILKRHKTNSGNELIFYRNSQLNENQVAVLDKSCKREQVYTVGKYQYLSQVGERVKIESVEQVIDAWVSERIWF